MHPGSPSRVQDAAPQLQVPLIRVIRDPTGAVSGGELLSSVRRSCIIGTSKGSGLYVAGRRVMTPVESLKAAYAAFARNDPSVLFGAMDPGVTWNEAEGNPLADRNPYIGIQGIGELFGRLLEA